MKLGNIAFTNAYVIMNPLSVSYRKIRSDVHQLHNRTDDEK
jgi:hypothetical protein